ncbi:hypothetical protein [Bacillus cereus]
MVIDLSRYHWLLVTSNSVIGYWMIGFTIFLYDSKITLEKEG